MSEFELPKFVLAERDALLSEIYTLFADITSGDGVSWRESQVLDDYGTAEECAEARATDPDHPWQELVDDPTWDPNQSYGGWGFLDAVGFRYYLPAAMIRAVRDSELTNVAHNLELNDRISPDPVAELVDILNSPQRLCVRRFLEYVRVADTYEYGYGDVNRSINALNSCWGTMTE